MKLVFLLPLLEVSSYSLFVTPNHSFYILSDITTDIPKFYIPLNVVKKVKLYILANLTFHGPSWVNILLSVQVSASLLVPLRDGLPIVVATSLGPVIMGHPPLPGSFHVV